MRPLLNAIWLTSFTLTSETRDIADVHVTPAEAALLTAVHYGITICPSELPSIAAGECYSGGLVKEDECRAALAGSLAKGWLQVIDEPTLARITDELRKGGFMGPIYHVPPVGVVDFTHVGAELWHGLRGPRTPTRPPFAFTDVVHSKTTRYFTTRAAALGGIPQAKECGGDMTAVGPFPIGPWRAQWWRRFPEGYRIDIEERQQWQGCVGQGEGCFMPEPREGADPQRLQHVLDRHNVTLPEWLLLAAMDRGLPRSVCDLPPCVAESASRQYGVTASEDECRTGLESCLRYGWLRIVDEHAFEQIAALLRDEPALMPVATEVGGRGEIDFAPCGAALYRMIGAEWLGSDWEEDLTVWKESYREEHRYCEAQEGLRGILQKYADAGEVVRASKVVPIGPWCVYWWERFPSGYRLELEIGQP
jgi:hypothetical protein